MIERMQTSTKLSQNLENRGFLQAMHLHLHSENLAWREVS